MDDRGSSPADGVADPSGSRRSGGGAPTLFLMVGLPGTGKTTRARQLEHEQPALRLTKDEWIKALYGAANPPAASDVIEGRLIAIALRTLELGVSVVIDFGLWARDERTALRHAAAERGAYLMMEHLTLDPVEQRRRIDARQAEAPSTTWPMSEADLADYSARFEPPSPGELDGTEPVGPPPLPHATWAQWRELRWPRTL